VYEVGEFAQVPAVEVSVCPKVVVPLIVGAAEFEGGEGEFDVKVHIFP